jgi:NAD(P)-dependent dehydrogenase (short-subunit alcohol dehydrogenase family)
MSVQDGRGAVVITGASSGIGRATALQLDRLGFRVFASVRSEPDGERLCAEGSDRLRPIRLDVTDEAAIASARDEVGRAVGEAGLAGLVNNAGVTFASPLEFASLEELRCLFEVNVFGLLAITQTFLPLLRLARGRLVNISSMATQAIAPFHGPYSASKLCVNGLSTALRLELMPLGVGVSTILCGNVRTPMWDKGIRLTEQLIEHFPPDAPQLYGAALRQVQAYYERIGRQGISPEAAARAIAEALTARRARNTYFVGPDARLFAILQLLVHGRLRDWVVMRTIGLSGRPESVTVSPQP